VRDEDVVVFANRDAERAAAEGSQPLPPGLREYDLAAVRGLGAERAARDAVAYLEHPFWIHLDADVLDDAIMPAVDYRMPDGLGWDEFTVVLRAALASGRAVGLEVTIFNPELDSDGAIAHALVDALAAGLT
jgi:arginase